MAGALIHGYNIEQIIAGFKNAQSIHECIFSGSTAIAFMCYSLNIEYDINQLLHDESDIDAYYIGNQPIYTKSFGDWVRRDSMPGKHVTFINGHNMPLNFHLEKVSALSYIEIEGFKFKTILRMLDDYENVLEGEDDRLIYKLMLLEQIKQYLLDANVQVKKMFKA